MANQKNIKRYLMEGENPYFKQDNRNGEILMLSGVWGSGKTHFWKNEVEDDLIKGMKNKSYVFISLYGKDSIEELQNEIQQLSYNFSIEDSKNIISSTFSVFTKVASFMPKVSFKAYGFGFAIDAANTAKKLEEENIKQQIEKGVGRLKDGGIICFDDFERKSSKIDLNDLFGFITNLTEVFKTKTVIITNQEFFKENDSEVFSRIKEKSVNKFLLLDPIVDELFNTIYNSKDEYTVLDDYKEKILEAIKITEEKNARIFIQVLDNCLEYKEQVKDENEIFMLTIITTLFVKYNFIFEIKEINIVNDIYLLPKIVQDIPDLTLRKIRNYSNIDRYKNIKNQKKFVNILKSDIQGENVKEEEIKERFSFIENNQDMLYQVYKYFFSDISFTHTNRMLINKLNNFVESGILLEDNV